MPKAFITIIVNLLYYNGFAKLRGLKWKLVEKTDIFAWRRSESFWTHRACSKWFWSQLEVTRGTYWYTENNLNQKYFSSWRKLFSNIREKNYFQNFTETARLLNRPIKKKWPVWRNSMIFKVFAKIRAVQSHPDDIPNVLNNFWGH